MSFAQERAAARSRIVVTVTGTVQGVGFRPFIHALASRLKLAGFVRNESGTVRIDVEGDSDDIERFLLDINANQPKHARVESVDWSALPPKGSSGFRIEGSASSAGTEILVPSDVATCEDCLRELQDPADRRFGYPFLACATCGPRLTVIEELPYDRERTTLRRFPLCEACAKEFEDPGDRRFHAQTIACPDCGPRLQLLDGAGNEVPGQDALGAVVEALARGKITAIKGLGGYHLACDAANSDAVRELRRRKRRDRKPLAVMVKDVAEARGLCEISADEEALLISAARPIVLLRRREGTSIAKEIFFSSPDLGVMIPYTPLHQLLLSACAQAGLGALVMTSGNESEQPIAYEDLDAVERLGQTADLFLVHDRAIHQRCDDSVVRLVAGNLPQFVRRSRGYAPEAIHLTKNLRLPVLATGAQLKNTFALGSGRFARLSHHIGDLETSAAYDAYSREIRHYESLFKFRPLALAHDLHPDYLSTRYAKDRARLEGLELIPIQHHHAHMASCMAENGLTGKAIGVSFDGTGFGADGNIWGGEFLVGGYQDYERAAHLAYVAMPGGDKAVREPWRMALSHLLHAKEDPAPLASCSPKSTFNVICRIIERRLNAPLTSSMGRLFDAVAALIGVRSQVDYEGQAAIELEWLAQRAAEPREQAYAFRYEKVEDAILIDPSPVISEIASDLRERVAGPVIARRFHNAVAAMIGHVCVELRESTGVEDVVLSGGVFMNALLLQESMSVLRGNGFRAHCHRRVPPNDGGISLGQLAVAAARLEAR